MPRILAEEISPDDFEPVEYGWEEEKAASTFLTDRARSLLDDGDAALGADLPLAPGVPVIEGAIARCRYQLIEPEIERFRQLGRDAGAAIGALARTLVPGQTEQQIARLAADSLAGFGIRSVVTLVAADERLQKYRHPVPTARKWDRVVMIVVCARRGGLIASLSRIVCSGAVPDQLQQRTNAVARVNARLLAATRIGATGADLYKTAAESYTAENYAGQQNLHHQGGATGYRTRDWVAHPASREQVQPTQAFAWNPSISGTKVEETCIVFEDNIEVITASPDWAQIAVEIDGKEYFAPDILSI
jgi:antitoxin VapB